MADKMMVLVTCASTGEARKIARAVVEGRFAACGNVLQAPVESVYRWKGKIESAKEFLLLLKTTRRQLTALERVIRRLHSYDTPEIVAVKIAGGSPDYLKWISESVRPEKR